MFFLLTVTVTYSDLSALPALIEETKGKTWKVEEPKKQKKKKKKKKKSNCKLV